ncbi:MAG: DnaJ domain-containing protein [Acidimicrobiia bacterium]
MATTRQALATDYYAELGVTTDATGGEIAAAFRALAKDLHPDTRPRDRASADRFKRVTLAYRVLRDPERRRRYDALRIGERPARRIPDPATPAVAHPVSRRGARWLVIGGIACLVIGAVVAALVLSLQRRDAALRRDGEPATATVVEVNGEKRLQFLTEDGEQVVAREGVRSGRGEDRVGDEVEVRYDPDDPGDIVRVESNAARDITLWIVAIKLLVGGLILAGIGARRLRNAS